MAKKLLSTWNLQLLYKSMDDPQIEHDVTQYEQACHEFARQYRDQSDWWQSAAKLLIALQDYEQLQEQLRGGRPLLYFYYQHYLRSQDEKIQAKINLLTDHLTKAENELLFFPLQLGKIPVGQQAELLANAALTPYHYFLERIFLQAQHQLAEAEEKIINLVSLPSYDLWTRGVDKKINGILVEWEGQKIPLAQAINLVAELPTTKRRTLHHKLMQSLTPVLDFAESELNAIVQYKKITDELKHYTSPHHARVLSNENDPTVIADLVSKVTTHFPVAHDFYAGKAQLLGVKQLKYADRSARVGQIKREYSYQESYDIIYDTLAKYDQESADILTRLAQNGQIDVYPRQGKQGGAFCSSSTGNPTFVLLNHVNNLDSLLTFAHEIGHAIHSELAKRQSPLYENYSLSTAETASTFFAGLVLQEVVAQLPPDERQIVQHDHIQDDINTIFRQIALFHFESDLHQKIRMQGALSARAMGELLNHHMQQYLGPLFTLTPEDGYFFVIWPHIRNFFYVYTYAYGQLVSKALQQRVLADPTYMQSVKAFLQAGGRQTPEKILADIGIDMQAVVTEGLTAVADEVTKWREAISR